MTNVWYPEHKTELSELIESYFKKAEKLKLSKKIKGKVSGIIVPHAGYVYSGEIAGKAFSLLKGRKNLPKKAIILSPSHYLNLNGVATHNQEIWKTSLGEIKIMKTKLDFPKADISIEHAIDNQIPFLQKLGFEEILPLIVGQVNIEQAGELAKKLSKIRAYLIISTDLSHFLTYEEANARDKQTINLIENLDTSQLDKIDACGIYPIMIAIHLLKIKKLKPKLVEYKNSGDITGDKSSVVGYASLYF